MQTLTLIRTMTGETGTSGTLIMPDGTNFPTLELPWYDNIPQFSCIPVGDYVCKYTMSPRLRRRTYEVFGVKRRAGIRIHSGNYAGDTRKGYKSHVQGCILPGQRIVLSGGQLMITSSQAQTRKFESLMNYKDFILRIIWDQHFTPEAS